MAQSWLGSLLLAALLLRASAPPKQKRKVVFFISGSSKFGTNPSRTFEKQILEAMDVFATQLSKAKRKDTTFAVYWGKKPSQANVHQAASFTDSKDYLINRRMRPFLDKVQNDQKYSSGEYSGLDGVISYALPNIYKKPVDANKVAIFFVNSKINMKRDMMKIINDPLAYKLMKIMVLFKWPNENCDSDTISSKLLTLRTQEAVDLSYCDGDLENEKNIESELSRAQQRAKLRTTTTPVITTTNKTTEIDDDEPCEDITCQLWFILGIIFGVLILLVLCITAIALVIRGRNIRKQMRRRQMIANAIVNGKVSMDNGAPKAAKKAPKQHRKRRRSTSESSEDTEEKSEMNSQGHHRKKHPLPKGGLPLMMMPNVLTAEPIMEENEEEVSDTPDPPPAKKPPLKGRPRPRFGQAKKPPPPSALGALLKATNPALSKAQPAAPKRTNSQRARTQKQLKSQGASRQSFNSDDLPSTSTVDASTRSDSFASNQSSLEKEEQHEQLVQQPKRKKTPMRKGKGKEPKGLAAGIAMMAANTGGPVTHGHRKVSRQTRAK